MKIVDTLSSFFKKGVQRKIDRQKEVQGDNFARQGAEMSLVSHIGELRKHIVRAVKWYVLLCCIAFWFMKPIIQFSQLPYTCYGFILAEASKAGESLQLALEKFGSFFSWPTQCLSATAAVASTAKTLKTIGLIEVMWVNFKMCMIIAAVLGAPFIMRELWLFIAPALYERERKIASWLIISSIGLFYVGILFGFFLIVPAFLAQTLQWAADYAVVEMTYENYFGSLTTLVMIFGIIFEVPVVISLLGLVGLLKPHHITDNRRILFLASFIIGALLAPPDVFSQTLVAIPFYLMCEVSVFALRAIQKSREAGRGGDGNNGSSGNSHDAGSGDGGGGGAVTTT